MSDNLNSLSQLLKDNGDFKEQIAFQNEYNTSLRVKVSDLQKEMSKLNLTNQLLTSDTSEVSELKQKLKQLEGEKKTLQEKNQELESKLEIKRNQQQLETMQQNLNLEKRWNK